MYHARLASRFDQRISDFAKHKFQRDGVEVLTGARVMEVTSCDIGFRDKWSGETKRLPYGMVVWSTGIGTRPVISDFMTKVGQVLQLGFPLFVSFL